MISVDLVSLGLGVVAVMIQLYLLARPHNNNLLFWLPFAMLLWAGHYFTLGSNTAGALHILAAATMFVAHFDQKAHGHSSLLVINGILALNVILGAVFYLQPADILMTLGNTFFAYCHLCLREQRLRIGYIVAEVVIASGAIMLGSIPGAAIAVLMIAMNCWSLTRWNHDESTSGEDGSDEVDGTCLAVKDQQ